MGPEVGMDWFTYRDVIHEISFCWRGGGEEGKVGVTECLRPC